MARHPLRALRTWLAVAAVGLPVPAGAPTEPPPVCVREFVAPRDLPKFLAEAVEVLSACGHAPEAFAAELRLDDPFSLAGTEREPEITAVFEPIDDERHYPLGVSASDPCVVAWIWRPEEFTDWQKLVLDRARTHAGETGAEWTRPPDRIDVRVTESRDHVGLRLWSRETAGSPELRVVLAKDDLTVIESDSTGD